MSLVINERCKKLSQYLCMEQKKPNGRPYELVNNPSYSSHFTLFLIRLAPEFIKTTYAKTCINSFPVITLYIYLNLRKLSLLQLRNTLSVKKDTYVQKEKSVLSHNVRHVLQFTLTLLKMVPLFRLYYKSNFNENKKGNCIQYCSI